MAQKVGKAPEIKVDWDIPEDWNVLSWERGPDGARYPIVEREVEVQTKVPVMTADGKQRFRTDRKGNDLGAMHRIERRRVRKKFRGVWSPRGKLGWQEHFAPSAEEVAQMERNKAAARFNEEMAQMAAERGITARQLVERVLGATAPVEKDVDGDDEPTYPLHKSFGSWELSDGTVTERGIKKEDAILLEAALHNDGGGGEPPGD